MKKRIWKIAKIILTISIAIVVLYTILVLNGKKNLYKDPISQEIVLEKEGTETTDSTTVEWQDNWVRYNGTIYEYNEEILTFLVMAIDQWEVEIEEYTNAWGGGQSDAMFLVVINPTIEAINVIAINRNTMTDIETYDIDGTYIATTQAQITLQHGYGDGKELSATRSVQAVSNLFYQLPIHGYVTIRFDAINYLNDAVGVVEVLVEEDMTDAYSTLVEGETVKLYGDSAYYYLRWRDTDAFDSASSRLSRQKQYLTAFIDMAKDRVKEDILFIPNIYQIIQEYMVTDIALDEASYLASSFYEYSFDEANIYSIPGETLQGEVFEEFYVDEECLYDLMIEIFYQEVENY
ncbi:MAG: LCP family protein [Lachnospiraceae bacterium]